MTRSAVLSIDLGTTGCRAGVFSAEGERLGYCHVEYGLSHPEPGAAEQDPEDWWAATRACLRAVAGKLARPAEIKAIGISAQGHSWVPVDARLLPLRPALTWLDTRATPFARELLEARGAGFWCAVAGKAPGPWHTLPQLLWLRQSEPKTAAAAAHFLYAHDFLLARLTGRRLTDYTTAAASLLLDVARFRWSDSLLAEYGVSLSALSPVVPAGSVAGRLSRDIAAQLGLAPGAIVAVGAQDQKCAALGAGLRPGMATVSLGTSTAISAMAQAPCAAPGSAIPCFPYLAQRTWVLEAPLTTTGAALKWLRDLARGLGAPDPSYADLTALAARSEPGSRGVRFLPFLAGAGAPHWLGEARGALAGLELATEAGDIARALLEGVAFEIRGNLEVMRPQGVEVHRLRLFGGGARSALWARIIADVTGLEVETSEDVETAGAGAAALALSAAGICDIPTAQRTLDRPGQTLEPHPEPRYEEAYLGYCRQRDLWLR